MKEQSFKDYEHIIVDGHSTDDTIKIISKYTKQLISSPAKGIANAMNIGLAKAKGKYIYFLNSDDSFYGPTVLQEVHNFLITHPQLDWAFGNIHETDGVKTIGFPPKRKIFQGNHPSLLKIYNYIPHQATFVKKTVFDKFGTFDESLKTMLDPEYWLRIAPHTKWDYMPIIVANYLVRSDAQSINKQHKQQNVIELKAIRNKYLNKYERVIANWITKAS